MRLPPTVKHGRLFLTYSSISLAPGGFVFCRRAEHHRGGRILSLPAAPDRRYLGHWIGRCDSASHQHGGAVAGTTDIAGGVSPTIEGVRLEAGATGRGLRVGWLAGRLST